MAVRWSEAPATEVEVEGLGPGERIGYDVVGDQQRAIVLGVEGEAVAITGSVNELLAFVQRVWEAVTKETQHER